MRPFHVFFEKGGLRYLKNALFCRLRGREPVWYFSFFVLLGASLLLLRCVAVGAEAFLEIFHLGTADLFGDFFAAACDAARGAAAYGERGVIYPPLGNLLLLVLSRLLPSEYLTENDAAAWRHYNGAVLFYVLLAVLSVAALGLCARRLLKSHAAALALCVSFPVCFLLERGNILLPALLPLLFFSRYFDSERPLLRELALAALGISAALKLYPLLFSLALAAARRWRALLRVLCYTALLCLLPSLFFGGPAALWLMVKNAFSFTTTGQNATHFAAALGLDAAAGTALLCALYFLMLCGVVLAVALRLPAPQLFALFTTALLCFSSIFSAYNWLLFSPALFALLEKKRLNGMEFCYFWCMVTPFFAYLPRLWQDKLMIVLLALLWVLLAVSCVRRVRALREGRG